MYYDVKAADLGSDKIEISVVFKDIQRNTISKNNTVKPAGNQSNMQNPKKGTAGANRSTPKAKKIAANNLIQIKKGSNV